MNNVEFYAYIGDYGPATVATFDHLWQFAMAIETCPPGLVEALTAANPKHARVYAHQESVFEMLDAPDPEACALEAAIAQCTDDAEALRLLGAASPPVRAEVEGNLAFREYDQEQLCERYRALILGE